MSAAATAYWSRGAQPLRYFIHDDSDALRMEIAGGLIGKAAQKAYEAWRNATLMARRLPLVIDISYVTDADEYGRAVLRRWEKEDVRLVNSRSPRGWGEAGSGEFLKSKPEAGETAAAVELPEIRHAPNAGTSDRRARNGRTLKKLDLLGTAKWKSRCGSDSEV